MNDIWIIWILCVRLESFQLAKHFNDYYFLFWSVVCFKRMSGVLLKMKLPELKG